MKSFKGMPRSAAAVAILLGISLFGTGCKKILAKKSPTDELLSLSMTSKNGGAALHYPPSFAAKKIDEAGVQASRNLSLGTDEAIVVLAIPSPISDELAEFDRVTFEAQIKSYSKLDYKEASHGAGKCAGRKGIVHDGSMRAAGVPYVTMHCSFMEAGHGYVVVYTYPQADLEQRALFERMIGALEFPVPAGSAISE